MNDTQAKSLSRAGLAAMVAAGLTTLAAPASAADLLLSGTIASASGEKMNGVTVSAKAEGSVTTTTVYTDEAGEDYFPALPAGKYQVWVQAVTFETAKGDVDLSGACPRSGGELHEGEAAPAPVRRSGARRVHRIRRSARGELTQQAPAAGWQRLDAGLAVEVQRADP